MEAPLTHNERANRLAEHVSHTLIECDCAPEFLKLMDEHIMHVACELPAIADENLLARYIGEINFCKGLRDGVTNALAAKKLAATG